MRPSVIPIRILSDADLRADWAERIAVGGSLMCLVHCLALPLVIAALPALSNALSIPEDFHQWVLALAIPTALVALVQGQARHHRRWPLAIGLVGLCLLACGAFLLDESAAETVVTVTGSLTLATAHIGNWRMRHAAGCREDACPADCC